MMARGRTVMTLVAPLLLASGCAHTHGASSTTQAEPPTFKQRISNIEQLLEAGRDDEASRELTAAEAAATTPRERHAVVYYEATVALDQQDYAKAQQLFQANAQAAVQANDPIDEAMAHNCLTWVHWATGDHAGALAENEKVKAATERPAMSADDRTMMLKHYWWDKAYLLAEGHEDGAADAARAEFEKITVEPDDHDGREVLAAWFAVVRGDGSAAKAAAEKVDAAKDGDLQDLYVLARAYELGGDAADAEAIRVRIRAGTPYAMKPLILREMVKDADRAKK